MFRESRCTVFFIELSSGTSEGLVGSARCVDWCGRLHVFPVRRIDEVHVMLGARQRACRPSQSQRAILFFLRRMIVSSVIGCFNEQTKHVTWMDHALTPTLVR